MTARSIGASVLLVALSVSTGCDQPEPQPETLRPVRTEQIVATSAGRARTFSGTARAGHETELSFRVPGSLDRLSIQVGDRIRAGQVLAQLERDDYEIAVRQSEASLDQTLANSRNTDADLERIRGLWENNNASQNDLDQALASAQSAGAQVEVARQTLEQARRQLGYTSLRAPVDGQVAEVPVEVGENVKPGDRIARMTSGDLPEVEVAIPGVLITQIRRDAVVQVRFSALPDDSFDAIVTEVGVAATEGATLFPVTVRLDQATDEVRSGMAAEVSFRFGESSGASSIYLPAYAVGEDRLGRFVFMLESTSEAGVGVVRRQSVTILDELTPEGRLEIVGGLQEGQTVVTAGVRRLSDGQRVRRLATDSTP